MKCDKTTTKKPVKAKKADSDKKNNSKISVGDKLILNTKEMAEELSIPYSSFTKMKQKPIFLEIGMNKRKYTKEDIMVITYRLTQPKPPKPQQQQTESDL